MSVIEDSRKVLQDFLAPELRAIAVRLDALEKRVDALDKKVDARGDALDRKIDDVDRRAERRHDEVMSAIRQVIDISAIQQRLARLESREGAHQ